MKRKRILVICLSAVLLLSLAALLLPTERKALNANWGLSIPLGWKQGYAADSGASFHGDGIRYHVFSYQNEEAAETMLAWSPAETPTLYYGSMEEAAEAWLDTLGVPPQNHPDYGGCQFWYQFHADGSELLVFYAPTLKTVSILERFL